MRRPSTPRLNALERARHVGKGIQGWLRRQPAVAVSSGRVARWAPAALFVSGCHPIDAAGWSGFAGGVVAGAALGFALAWWVIPRPRVVVLTRHQWKKARRLSADRAGR